jgi:hypothetical protein
VVRGMEGGRVEWVERGEEERRREWRERWNKWVECESGSDVVCSAAGVMTVSGAQGADSESQCDPSDSVWQALCSLTV